VHRRYRLRSPDTLYRLRPLANGATSLMFEGVPTYPTPERFWKTIDKFSVTVLHAPPPSARSWRSHQWPRNPVSRRFGFSAPGEPINPKHGCGITKISVIKTARSSIPGGQTETRGILINPLPGGAYPQTEKRQSPVFRR